MASEASTPHLIFALAEYEGIKNPGFPLLSFYQLSQPLLGLNDLLKQYEQSSLQTTTPLETTIGNLKAFYLSTQFYQPPPPEDGYSFAETCFRIEYMFDYQGKIYSCELITSERNKDRYNPVFEKFCHSIRLK